ncbi:DUF58 domain-containing protein [Arthrobacter pascens]|uniref:DUF58 domain-containing protein n=1 Tax=Arthrobacter pascens TaxID=1677 RepID=UPI00196AD545|nr:DUF58 domain-containing protein [Arthrobacter pascens]MBN3499133.1 DUF58 domain-containing protein [Arthrobacter pascens]
MALLDHLPRHLFTSRGWGLLAAGTLSLLCAQVMGRRDLLGLGVLLVVLPLIALAGIRLVKPRFRVYREFSPATVETASATTVRLAVARTGPEAGRIIMEERLPSRFGESPAFRFPSRSASGGTSRYEYRLRSGKRGQFTIGPVTAEFTDPFGLSLHRHTIDDGDTLTVTPAAVELPVTGLAGARGNDGITATRIRANPSDDDVMTREYRHGDPMRRVHWPATARHGALMVRQEESVTTPEATIILDQRFGAHSSGFGSVFSGSGDDGNDLVTSDTFEWAVTAAMSVSAHLSDRNYSLRFLDAAGDPAFHRSPSAPEPDCEEYSGAAGLQSIAESLAAIQLSGPHHLRREQHDASLREHSGGSESGQSVFDDRLIDKLAAHRMRGPVLAVLGRISLAEARALAPAAGYAANAFAIVITDRPAESSEVLEALRLGGWRAVSVDAATSLPAAWTYFDEGDATLAAAAADVRRGAEVTR